METALRCLSPEFLVCDELGEEDLPTVSRYRLRRGRAAGHPSRRGGRPAPPPFGQGPAGDRGFSDRGLPAREAAAWAAGGAVPCRGPAAGGSPAHQVGAVRGLGALLVLLSGGLWGLFQAKKLWGPGAAAAGSLQPAAPVRRQHPLRRAAFGEWVRQEEKASRFCWEAARRPCFAADPKRPWNRPGKACSPGRKTGRCTWGSSGAWERAGCRTSLEHIQLYEALLGPCLGKARGGAGGEDPAVPGPGAVLGITLCLPCCDRPERKEGKALWTWI